MPWSPLQAPSDDADLPAARLPAGCRGRVDADGLTLSFARPWRCLSSAVANGGLVTTRGLLNMHLREDRPLAGRDPAAVLGERARALGLPGDCVGMMTGASMRSLRLAAGEIEGHRVAAVLTAGLSNARRAGDRAEQAGLHPPPGAAGTINLALVTAVPLTDAALAETLSTLTEAKAATLQSLGVTSPVSGGLATGTGTDATAVLCPPAGRPVRYAGKHTRFGELAARLVMDALVDSLAWYEGIADAG